MPPPIIIIVHVLLYLLSLICMFFIIIIVSIIFHFIFCVFLYIYFLPVWSSETDHNRILRSNISAILPTSNFYPSLFSIITVIISMTNIIIENHLNHIINKNYYQLSAAYSRLKGQLNIAVFTLNNLRSSSSSFSRSVVTLR